jgi:5'(3')-deoxyribonucleotidase
MRIAIDIDSTLHHYWDILSEVSVRRFGIELPYDEQLTWGITRLRPEQLQLCIDESHSDERILAGTPYPGAVHAVRGWHEEGHFVHITSHRAVERKRATAAWLERIGLPFDDLHCSYDKVSRCVELEIDLLIDDGPLNLAAALQRGIVVATIRHPWNKDLCEEEDVICARDWLELERKLAPVLARQGTGVGAAN